MSKPSFHKDPLGAHVRLYHAILDSPAWGSLSATDQRVYIALRRSLNGSNNGDISLPLSRARHHQVSSPATLAKSLRALVATGLIAVTRRGGCTRGGQRLPTLYRFTDQQVYEMRTKFIEPCKATDEWKLIDSRAHGKALIREAEAAAQRAAAALRLLQELKRTDTPTEAVRRETASGAEPWAAAPIQSVKQVRSGEKAKKASNDADLARPAAA